VIPAAYITEWRSHAPWTQNAWVEQDLIISRALVDIFGADGLADSLAFRGGTALYKLYLTPAARYSEDIDLVQTRAEPISDTLDRVRGVLCRQPADWQRGETGPGAVVSSGPPRRPPCPIPRPTSLAASRSPSAARSRSCCPR
jgi:hypothetical protein